MIARPLDLASRLRPPPAAPVALYLSAAGLLALFFAIFGSRFVLAPGVAVDFRLPRVVGAEAGARPATHVVTIISSGQIFIPDGLRKLPELGEWLRAQARVTPQPLLLVRAGTDVAADVLAEVASLAREASFEMIWAAGEPVGRK